jgi:hypothetical protein
MKTAIFNIVGEFILLALGIEEDEDVMLAKEEQIYVHSKHLLMSPTAFY